MANFSQDTDLTFYQPDILTFGIANFTSPNDYHAQARADIERDLRIKWFPVYAKETYRDIAILNTTEMDATLLTDAQFKRASVFRVIGFYACPQLTKFNSNDNPDRFQVAKGYRIEGSSIKERKNLQEGLKKMLDHKGPYLLEVMVGKENNVFPMVPQGCSVSEIRLK